MPLAARALSVYSSPNGSSAIVATGDGAVLFTAGRMLTVAAAVAEERISAAWDRDSSSFVICQAQLCESRSTSGDVLEKWSVVNSSRAAAYSARGGLVIETADGYVWVSRSGLVYLGELSGAVFRPGSEELLALHRDGMLKVYTAAGQEVESMEWLPGAAGIVVSADGGSLFGARLDGTASILDLRRKEARSVNLETTVEGVWPAPGEFAVRLHESLKAPVAFLNAREMQLHWMPALEGAQ
jgi:hypothetical protein